MLSRAERELSGLKIIARRTATSRYTRSSVPVDEVFWFAVGGFLCYDHRRWCDELDSNFPYFAEGWWEHLPSMRG